MICAYYINLLFFACKLYSAVGIDSEHVRDIYVNKWIQLIGDGESISEEDLRQFYKRQLRIEVSDDNLKECLQKIPGNTSGTNETCLTGKCLSPDHVYSLSGLSNATTAIEVSTLSMMVLHTVQNNKCKRKILPHSDPHRFESVTKGQIWGYGILSCTIIVLTALLGFLALPFIRGVNFKRTLIFMVGLAVGTLAGSSLLFLIPEALELTEQELNKHSYLWKCLVMISALYFFFIIERLLKHFSELKEINKKEKELRREIRSGRLGSLTPETKFRELRRVSIQKLGETSTSSLNKLTDFQDLSTISESSEKNQPDDISVIKEEGTKDPKRVAPVAWMIIFGDALHNFVDGVSIGAAFTESILGGLSISVAILCEELPHELGDFAVLLHGGMSKKKAIFYNFLSACSIYVGLVIGIILGENAETHTWVFAFAGGMFLYIALADMMPEMCAAGEQEENQELIGTWMIFVLQNLGMVMGFGIMLLLAIYGGKLEDTITGHG
ncbi:metal cation symporter ZIP8-like [Ruditapes philippinarum]|uniref:metal cation symporter ZIP8-like n=1 Tax=Ruditapes philippinarum TaxID=129788 RepID=UPI00295BAFB4|nr:metal cation symporter ZIP8-like [Ruditapes philippinarum]